MKWMDATRYSRSDKERVPRTWEIGTKALRLVVTKMHGCGDDWYLQCHNIGIALLDLRTKSLDVAKERAVGIVMGQISRMADTVSEIDLATRAARERGQGETK